MRALHVHEIDNLVDSLTVLQGAPLQEVVVGATGVGLGFWTRGQGLVWLWFENHSWSPLLLPLSRVPEGNIKPLKPLALFLRAHFVDQPLRQVQRDLNLGRALIFDFGEGDKQISIHLWPHGANFIARAEDRQVSWKKIETPSDDPPRAASDNPSVRSLQEILEQWVVLREQRQDRGAPQKSTPLEEKMKAAEKRQQGEIKRIERAIGKVQDEITQKKESPWREVGEHLVTTQNLQVPDAFLPFVDRRRSLAWNIENCFSRGKELKRKLLATEERLRQLQQELKHVQDKNWQNTTNAPQILGKSHRASNRDAKSSARFRTVELPGGLVARLGRSAQDNIQLLKEARTWDIWLHLRGHPGSHAILVRDKKKEVGDEILRVVGKALVEQTFGHKVEARRGERFELIVAECRFVKPQRGDKKGRVTYTHDRTVGFKFS